VTGYERNGQEVMTLLLGQRGDEVKIAEDVVKAAACNLGGKGLLKLLLERGPTLLMTDKIGRVQMMRNIYAKATRLSFARQGHPRDLYCA
jgi:hypothetical protein